MAKRKRTTLPRITLLAYSRRDLLEFCAAVEALRCIAADLRIVADDLARKTRRSRSPVVAAEEGANGQ